MGRRMCAQDIMLAFRYAFQWLSCAYKHLVLTLRRVTTATKLLLSYNRLIFTLWFPPNHHCTHSRSHCRSRWHQRGRCKPGQKRHLATYYESAPNQILSSDTLNSGATGHLLLPKMRWLQSTTPFYAACKSSLDPKVPASQALQVRWSCHHDTTWIDWHHFGLLHRSRKCTLLRLAVSWNHFSSLPWDYKSETFHHYGHLVCESTSMLHEFASYPLKMALLLRVEHWKKKK